MRVCQIFVSRFLNSAVVVLVVAADGLPLAGMGSERKSLDGHADDVVNLHNLIADLFSSFGVRILQPKR